MALNSPDGGPPAWRISTAAPMRWRTGRKSRASVPAFVKLAERVPADCLVGEVLCEREAQELMRAT